ncbi:3-methyladenine DNA glycosylase AlkD [Pseudarthrobacter siccitolerans]|uniref:3-methyladenine DNA glycosylase AlkD n=1 Tax=Pseudarthrobacter siccitolerans TaxID=861266 RepID=A0ABU0PGX8_9MICC|nr:DNA alkylation repair protein [Pseudarthrobacter siccitolerans]MDQ0673218.1 3-methyladenine DNA glycosylase AlkD [Pseudarthrobacter siccitolerans]
MVNRELLELIRSQLRGRADPARASGVQAYMKSIMPSLGVRVPEVRRLTAAAVARYPFGSGGQLRATALELWRTAGFREERYAAIDLTAGRLVATDLLMLPVYEEIIRHGAWWDFADGVAGRICALLQANRPEMTAVVLGWSTDADFWIRRASLTAQLKAKARTDPELLRSVIEVNLADPEFFIRKAIGWALREYAKTAPEWVAHFVAGHEGNISPLSRREALKNLPR